MIFHVVTQLWVNENILQRFQSELLLFLKRKSRLWIIEMSRF